MERKARHGTVWKLMFIWVLSLMAVIAIASTAIADDSSQQAQEAPAIAIDDPDAALEELFSTEAGVNALEAVLAEVGAQEGQPAATTSDDVELFAQGDEGTGDPVGRLKILARYNDSMQFYDGHVYLLFTSYQDGVTFTVNDLYAAYDIADQYYPDIAADISNGSNHTGSDADRYFSFNDERTSVTLNRGQIVTIGMYRDFDMSVPQAALGSIQNSSLWSKLSNEAKAAVVGALLQVANGDSLNMDEAVANIQAVLTQYGSDINYLLDGVVDGGVCFNRELYNQKLEWDQYENVTYEMDITQAQLDKMALYLSGNLNKFSILKNSCATVALRAWNAIVGEDDQIVTDGSGIYQYIDAPKSVRDAIRDTFEGREDYHWNSAEGGEQADPEAGYTDETGWVYVSAPEPVEPLTFIYADESLLVDADHSSMGTLLAIAKQGQDVSYSKGHQEIPVTFDVDAQDGVTTIKRVSFDINGTVVSLDENSQLPDGIWLKAQLAEADAGSCYVTDADGNALQSSYADGWISFRADALPVSYQVVSGAEGTRNLLTTTIVNGEWVEGTTEVYRLVDGQKQLLGAKEEVASGTKIYISPAMDAEELDYVIIDITFDGTPVMDAAHYDAEADAYVVVMPESYAKLTITYGLAYVSAIQRSEVQVAVGDELAIDDYAELYLDGDEADTSLLAWSIIFDEDEVISLDEDGRTLKAQKEGECLVWAGVKGNDNIGVFFVINVVGDRSALVQVTYPEYDVLVHYGSDANYEDMDLLPQSGYLIPKGSHLVVEPYTIDPLVIASLTCNGAFVAAGEDIVVNEDTEIEATLKEAVIEGMPSSIELAAQGDTYQLDARVRYKGLIDQFRRVYDPSITYVSSNDLVSVDENGLITVVGEVPEGGLVVTVTAYAGSSYHSVNAKTKVVVGDYDGNRIVGRLTMHARHIEQRELVAHCCATFTTYEDCDLDVSYCHYYEPTEAYKSLMEDYRDHPENYDSDPALYNDNELGLEDRESYFIEHSNGAGSEPATISLRCGESITLSNYNHDPSNMNIIMGTLLNGDMASSKDVQELARQLGLYASGSDEYDGAKTFDSLLSAFVDMYMSTQWFGENPANGRTLGGFDVNRELYNQFRSTHSQMPNSFYTVELTADEFAALQDFLADPSNNYYSFFVMNCGTGVAAVWNTTLADRPELAVSPSYTGVAEDPESLYFEIIRITLETGKYYDPSVEHSEGGGRNFYPRSVRCPYATDQATWKRLYGSTRYDTMASVVTEGFRRASTAVLASGANFPDALVSSSVAGALRCPVILTKPGTLVPQAQEQLERLGVEKVYIMGGEAAVSTDVEDALVEMGLEYERIQGANRQATTITALQMIDDMGAFDGTVVVATGYTYADALSIGPWSYKAGAPILLTNKKGELTDDQVAAAKSLGVTNAIIVGGGAAVSDAVTDQLGVPTTRLAGASRYETSKAIAEWEMEQGMAMGNVTVTTGKNFPDALAGAPLCGKRNSVLLLAKDKDSAGLSLISNTSGVRTGYVLGGTAAVSDELFAYLESLTA